MTLDLLYMQTSIVLDITSVEALVSEGVLVVKGRKLSKATKFYIDGRPVTSFTVVSDSEVRISWPYPVQDIIGTQALPAVGVDGDISLGWAGLKKVSGSDRVVQRFLKFLFQTPGTDTYAPDSGAGLTLLFSLAASDDQISAAARNAVASAASQVQQSEEDSWPDEEKLASVDIISLTYDAESNTVGVALSLITAAGTTARIHVG